MACPASMLRLRLLPLALVAGIAGCASNGDTEQVTLRLDSDATCYGFQVDFGKTLAPTLTVGALLEEPTCRATRALEEAGCTPTVFTGDDELHLGARGCFVADGTPLFDCELPRPLAATLEREATVRCGCGCADTCPTTPAVEVCRDSPSECASTEASEREAEGARRVGTTHQVQTTATSTSTTNWCGTCCDLLWDMRFVLVEAPVLSEIEFEFAVPDDGPRCPSLTCRITADVAGPSGVRPGPRVGGRYCLSDPAGIVAPERLVACEYISESEEVSEFRVIRALTTDLEPAVVEIEIE